MMNIQQTAPPPPKYFDIFLTVEIEWKAFILLHSFVLRAYFRESLLVILVSGTWRPMLFVFGSLYMERGIKYSMSFRKERINSYVSRFRVCNYENNIDISSHVTVSNRHNIH
jgi:hypothetical protein